MIKWYVDPSPFPPHTHILNAASHPQFCCQCVSQCRMIWVTGHTGHGQNVSMCSWLIIDGGNSVVSVLFVGKLLPVSSWLSLSFMDEPLMPCQHCSPSICISCANSTLTVLCVWERWRWARFMVLYVCGESLFILSLRWVSYSGIPSL